nr:C1 family peptidase [uncultured Methanobrevibacter sp.]
MKNIKFIAFISLLLFLLVVPVSCAMDSETLIADDNNSTDYYFDIGADKDGDGQKETPFNNFTSIRVNDNSTIHMAKGEYVLNESREFSNISFYGESPQKTVLNGNGTALTINGVVNFKNLTLTNFKISNAGDLNGFNVIFNNLISTPVKNNDFGGAIYAPSNKNIYLDNCTFFDNHAQYGGAIYANGGNLTIVNSLFHNVYAFNYGGAIVGNSRLKAIINNTRFFNVKSIDDAGGAIYLLSSSLIAYNLTIANASSTFGPAITALRSDLNISNSLFENNTARYEGGAVYAVYGSVSLNSSRFISNSARNGGAVFIDDATVLNITNNDFINNSATSYAGAIYCLLKSTLNLSGNNFNNNSAELYDDIYNSTMVNLDIGNGNYTLYIYNQTYNLTMADKYDLRDYGWVTPVKNQYDGGNCWAFAAMASLESCILKASGEVLDLSEENMKNLMAYYSDYGRNIRAPNDGGDNDMPVGYLVSWLGPVSEDDEKYDDLSHISPVLKSLMHVQNVLFLKRDNFTDNNPIKQAILKYGAVATTMFYNISYVYKYGGKNIVYHCYEGNSSTNHAVAIVGWDDTLNVNGKAGAWIVKNSWGPNWPEKFDGDGYFYVSYYDVAFARPGNYASYTFILNDTQRFDRNYQYDISGVTDYFWFTSNQVWYENAYHATDNEFLSAVSTYFNKNTQWEINVYVNSRLQTVQNGTAAPGYYTINLDSPIPLAKGDLFEIMFKIKVDGDVAFPISEDMSLTKCTYMPNVSFVSYDFGSHWYDLYDLVHYYPSIYAFNHHYASQVACIKGFTQFKTLNSTIKSINVTYDSLDLFNIVASLFDEDNNTVKNGNVTFTIDGENHTVEVYRGLASLQISLGLGCHNISASFSSPNYYSSYSITAYKVLPVNLDVNVTVAQDFNNAFITFNISQPINETLLISINCINTTVNSTDGVYVLNLTDLDYGNYKISIKVVNEFYNCTNSTSFFVNVKRTQVILDNLTTFYKSGEGLNIILLDELGQKLNSTQVKIVLNNETYLKTTDGDGNLFLDIDLDVGNYTLEVYFEGDGLHVKSQNSSQINITPSKTRIDIAGISYDSFNLFNITVNVYDQLNRILGNDNLTLTVNGHIYSPDKLIPFVVGLNNISALFNSSNYYSSYLNTTFNVSPVLLNVEISVVQDFNRAYVTFTLSQKVNETLLININHDNCSAKSFNGVYVLNLTDMDYGEYRIDALIDSDFYDGENSTTLFVNVKRTHIEVENMTTIYNSGDFFIAKLKDQFGQPVANRTVRFNLNNEFYYNLTNDEGIAVLSVSITNSVRADVSFESDELYVGCVNSSKITVKSSVSLPATKKYALNSVYEVSLLDKKGNPLNSTQITIRINNVDYSVKTDIKGNAEFTIPLHYGNYDVYIKNPDTDEILSQNIDVVKRITENRDMSVYYGKCPYYKVRVCDDNGNYISGILVKFTINKKVYNLKTDSKGYASLKINLKSGKYTITATYKGYSVSNKITVKPTLITKNKSIKKGKTLKFTAKLLNKNGKALKNKKITFKIKGKIYKAKTNKKGIATIKIKNLKRGKYTITTKYGKLKNTNRITVKK